MKKSRYKFDQAWEIALNISGTDHDKEYRIMIREYLEEGILPERRSSISPYFRAAWVVIKAQIDLRKARNARARERRRLRREQILAEREKAAERQMMAEKPKAKNAPEAKNEPAAHDMPKADAPEVKRQGKEPEKQPEKRSSKNDGKNTAPGHSMALRDATMGTIEGKTGKSGPAGHYGTRNKASGHSAYSQLISKIRKRKACSGC